MRDISRVNTFQGRAVVVTALTGSHNYNMNTAESDRDFKLFVAPTFEDLFAGDRFSFAEQSDTVDFSVHDVRKLSELIWKSNPAFLEVLFSREHTNVAGLDFLFDNAEHWAQMNIPQFFTACTEMSREKMNSLHKGTAKTAHLIERFGFDTKQATHALRLLFVVQRFWQTESMAQALWFPKGNMRTTLLSVKAGEVTEAEFMALVADWHRRFDVSEMAKNFHDAQADESRKAELDQRIFEFVRSQILTG